MKKIVIIGGGFAGIEFVKKMANQHKYEVVLVDQNNYNFFPPLLYQVASSFMEPSAISYPFRRILRGKNSVRFRMGTLQKVLPTENKIVLDNGEFSYDILIMSTGTESNFFGNKNIEENSLPMKTISDSLSLRNTILSQMEKATRTTDPAQKKRLETIVIAGAGPTGVELSGILAETKKSILKKDYPDLNGELGEIYLVDGSPVVLGPMSDKAHKYTYDKLAELGIKIKLGVTVKDYKDDVVYFSDNTTLETTNLIWTAGVKAKQFEGFAAENIGHAGRLQTNTFNLVSGYNNIYALGDCAIMVGDAEYPKGHPQLAQPAIQQAKNLAKNLMLADKESWKPFHYKDLGSMAIIGRNKAVVDTPKNKLFFKGVIAFIAWFFVHIMNLVNFKNRVAVFFNWVSYYFFKDQYFRMIISPNKKTNQPINTQ